jgi:hypothetical protein
MQDYDKKIKETMRRERKKKDDEKVARAAEKATKQREAAPKSNTTSEKRLANRNLSQSASDISPKMGTNRKADSAKRLSSSAARQPDYTKGPNMGGKPTKNTDTSYRMPAKTESFKEAFAANRKAGNKTFEWKGNKYTTNLATDKKAGSTKSDKGNYGTASNIDTSIGPSMSAKASKKSESSKTKDREKSEDLQKKAQRALQPGQTRYKRGGSVRSTDGCAVRGKTKGRYI